MRGLLSFFFKTHVSFAIHNLFLKHEKLDFETREPEVQKCKVILGLIPVALYEAKGLIVCFHLK